MNIEDVSGVVTLTLRRLVIVSLTLNSNFNISGYDWDRTQDTLTRNIGTWRAFHFGCCNEGFIILLRDTMQFMKHDV